MVLNPEGLDYAKNPLVLLNVAVSGGYWRSATGEKTVYVVVALEPVEAAVTISHRLERLGGRERTEEGREEAMI